MHPQKDPRDPAVLAAQERFVDQYFAQPPYGGYLVSVGVTTRLLVEVSRRQGTRSRKEIAEDLRRTGEDPDELCLLVELRKRLPRPLRLPTVYMGLKVHSEIVGQPVGQLG